MTAPACCVALIGNPNVGKSTVFNALTGLKQHTGNWAGKTVSLARGAYAYCGRQYQVVDLPGVYSLLPVSNDERISRDYLLRHTEQPVVIVADATALSRNLYLALAVRELRPRCLLCLNLLDEAEKKGLRIDRAALAAELGMPVIGAAARSGRGMEQLKQAIALLCAEAEADPAPPAAPPPETAQAGREAEREAHTTALMQRAERIAGRVLIETKGSPHQRDRRLDRLLTSRRGGIPVMLLLLMLVFWITLKGANHPSAWLAAAFNGAEAWLSAAAASVNFPPLLHGLLISGMFRTLGWVVSVMLPPMAIFFPLFTLLEDSGYLPRVAFNLDKFFRRAGAHGKQALTMCMGFGCNACGVIGCRIIDSPRERLIAMLTNNFVPCNGRFPTLIAIIAMFFAADGGQFLAMLLLTAIIVCGVGITLLVSRLLSHTLLKGLPSSFILELPPYRRPQFGQVIIRSVLDRTLFVLGRAMLVAAPAGMVIWGLANIQLAGGSLLQLCVGALDPLARFIGLDGVLLLAFILGFPANEIVLPLALMGYLAGGGLAPLAGLAELKLLLVNNGWTWITALCALLFSLLHFPCATTCLTIKKESGSWKWTAAAFLLPTLTGFIVCALVNHLCRLLF